MRRAAAIGALVLALLGLALPAAAVTLTITDASPTWTASKQACCPAECPTCVVSADVPAIAAAGPDADYTAAFNSWNNEPGNAKGWTLVSGGVLNGSFQISTYDAGFEGCAGGVKVWIQYVRGEGDPDPAAAGVGWSQAIDTNAKLPGAAGPGNPYLDVLISDDEDIWPPPMYPYQYVGKPFYDFPKRGCPDCCLAPTSWEGHAYLTEVDYTNKKLTIYEGVEWGFNIQCVPEPLTMLGVFLGLAGLGAYIRRRRIG